MTAYLLALSVGPVQEFIAAARRTRDLWYGSELLSATSREAALALRQGGADLIFPSARSLDGDGGPAVANKIVAIVPTGTEPGALAEAARAAALTHLEQEGRSVIDRALGHGLGPILDEGRMREQLAGFLEFYAAWVPYMPTMDGDYARARKAVERLLAGRKALRDFTPAGGVEGLPKSALDPSRETVLYHADRKVIQNLTPRLAGLGIKASEHLDGVSLVKRLAQPRRFVSVSRVAADPWLRRLSGDPRLDELRRLARDLIGSGLVESLPERAFLRYDVFPFDTELFYDDGSRDQGLTDVQKGQARAFFQRVRQMSADVGDPPAYLAVLAADGDRMGTAISHLQSPDEHRALSEALAGFAQSAAHVVTDHHGALVYSGGDDVLAFLPLDQALECAGALANSFGKALAGLHLDDQQPTLSVGVSIGHFSERLGTLLDWARDAEHHAKKSGRNALAIALHTRSGGADNLTVTHRWGEGDGGPLARWGHWVAWYRDDVLPDGAAYELRTLVRELRALSTQNGRTADELAPMEAKRILTRKRGQQGAQSLTTTEVQTVLAMLVPRRVEEQQTAGAAVLECLEGVVDEMIVARHLARAQKVAGTPGATRGGAVDDR